MSATTVQPMLVTALSYRDDLALEEALDALDPLRHYRIGEDANDLDSTDITIIPIQHITVAKSITDLSFGGNFDGGSTSGRTVSIKLSVDASPGCGGVAWPAGEILASYLVRAGPRFLKDRRIVEVGSGTGLVGLICGAMGGKVWITDQPPLLEIMHHNVVLNGLASNVMVSALNWGEPLPDGIPQPDLVLAADCVYFEPAFPLLVQTLSDLAVDAKTEVLFCYKRRRKADKRFFTLLRKKFTWTEVTDNPDREVYSREQISLLKLVKKH